MLEYLGVAKRICLYLARVSPQQTIDHLVYEVSLQLLEEEAPGGSGHTGSSGSGSAAGGPGGAAAAGAGAGAAAGGCGALEFAAALRADAAGGHDGGEAAAAAAAAGGAQQALAAAAGEPGGAASTPSSESAFRASFGSLAAAGAASSSTLPASAFSAAGYPSLSGTATPGLSITGAAGAAASCAEQQQQQQQQALGQRGLRASANSLGLSRGSSGAYGDLRDSGHVPSSSVCNTPSGAQAAAAGIGSSLRRSFTDQSDVGSSISSVSGVAGMPGGGPSASAVEPQAAAAAAGGGLALAAAGATGLGREGSTASSLGSILLGAAGGGQSASAAPGGVLGSITEREWVAGGGSAGAAAAARGGDAGGGGGSGMAGFNAALLCAHDLDLSVYYAAQPHSGSATSQHGGRQAGAGAGGAGGVPQREDGGMSWLAGAGGVMMIPHSSPRQTRDREAATPALRGLVTRSELALCLLTEVRGWVSVHADRPDSTCWRSRRARFQRSLHHNMAGGVRARRGHQQPPAAAVPHLPAARRPRGALGGCGGAAVAHQLHIQPERTRTRRGAGGARAAARLPAGARWLEARACWAMHVVLTTHTHMPTLGCASCCDV
jgi:hypothetical protein